MDKRCKQCGELKPIEQFRRYYGGRKGTYRTCKLCEKINSRAKYLEGKGDKRSAEESEELQLIKDMYAVQLKAGFKPPTAAAHDKVTLKDSVKGILDKYAKADEHTAAALAADDKAMEELNEWLTKDLTEAPEYYLDDVYERLTEKYRPVVSINSQTLLPVYDDTYKDILSKILHRFDVYEDSYYAE